MKWYLKKFDDLTLKEFHDILQLRINIFVVEQDCPYPELDGKDEIAYHFFAVNQDNNVLAYTRLFKPGDSYEYAAIGRVVVHEDFRGKKLGHDLIKKSIEQVENLFGTSKIKIGAQTHLLKFYEFHGFVKIGEDYIEDGIPHIHMLRD